MKDGKKNFGSQEEKEETTNDDVTLDRPPRKGRERENKKKKFGRPL
jgi:hypothetical protein